MQIKISLLSNFLKKCFKFNKFIKRSKEFFPFTSLSLLPQLYYRLNSIWIIRNWRKPFIAGMQYQQAHSTFDKAVTYYLLSSIFQLGVKKWLLLLLNHSKQIIKWQQRWQIINYIIYVYLCIGVQGWILHILTNRPALNAKCPPKNLMFLNNNNLVLHMIKILTGDGCKPGGQSLAFLHFGKWNHSD